MTGVAKVHDTTLTPTKIELLQDWLPRQSWFEGSTPVSYTHLTLPTKA